MSNSNSKNHLSIVCNKKWAMVNAGSGSAIAMDSKGQLWVIGSRNDIYYHNGRDWVRYPPKTQGFKGTKISIGPNDVPYVIGEDKKVYKVTPQKMVSLDGGNNTDIAVDSKGRVYVLGNGSVVYQRTETTGWNGYIDAKPAKAIAIDPKNDTPYILGTDNIVYKGGNSWTALGGVKEGYDITIDAHSRVWIIGDKHQIYYLDGSTWKLCKESGTANALASDPLGNLAKLDTNTVTFRTGFLPICQKQWKQINAGSGTDVAGDSQGRYWHIGSHNDIYYHNGKDWVMYRAKKGESKGKRISIGPNDIPYVIGVDGKVYKVTPEESISYGGGNNTDIAVNSQGVMFVLGNGNAVYQRSDTAGWNGYMNAKPAKAIAIDPVTDRVYIMGTDNIVYRGGGSDWAPMGGVGTGYDIAVDSDGRVWIVGDQKQIYHYDGVNWLLCSSAGKANALGAYLKGGGLAKIADNSVTYHTR